MKKIFLLIVLASFLASLSDVAYAGYAEGNAFSSGNTNTTPAPDAYGQVVRIAGGSRCKATAAPPSYSEGDEVPLSCELDGDLRTNGAGGGGGAATIADGADVALGALADAAATAGSTGSVSAKLRLATSLLNSIKTAVEAGGTAANQATLNGYVDGLEALLTTIDTDTGNIASGVGATSDAAVAAGDAGSVTAQLRRLTTDLASVKTAVELLDDAISGTKLRAMMVDSSGNEIVIPTAGLIHNIVSAASTNATNVVAGAATAYHISLRNTTTTAYSFRLYNTVGAPTCSSATGYVTTVIAPPASAAGQVGGSETPLNIGAAFPTGLSYCITGGPTSTDNTNAAVGVYGFIMYKAN